jgi:heptosyltransferase-3
MRILLIKPKQIGDSLILTPTIRAIRQAHPGAEIWVLVRRGCEGILAGCPDIARVLTLAGVEKSDRRRGDIWRQMRVLLELWRVRFDFVFELGDGHRARLFAMLARTRRRCSVKTTSPLKPFEARRFEMASFDWTACHRIEKDYRSVSEFLHLPAEIPPMIFEPTLREAWPPASALGDFAVVQVGSRQGFNRWHRDGWRDVCRALLERLPHVVLTCGPVAHEREEASSIQRELGPRVLNTDGGATWAQMAWLLGRARIYVGPNTAAMHLAAACSCPVVALFGPSIEDHWHPWQTPYRIVTSPGYVPPADAATRYAAVKQRTMESIRAEDVIAACDALLR